ncbi:MAG: VIT domain-containing protein, partial [Bacteroidota bacterium]
MRTATCAFLALLCVSLSTAQSPEHAYLHVLHPQRGGTAAGVIEDASFTVQPAGLYMEIGVFLTLSADGSYFQNGDSLETALYFTLPEEAVVTDSWLWVGDDIVRAEIIDRWTARTIYENIVRRRQDPSVLFKNGRNYELRVYPLIKGEERRIKMTYQVPATWTLDQVTAALPTHLLRASGKPIAAPRLRVWTDETWTAPAVIGGSEVSRTEGEFDGRPFVDIVLPANASTRALSVALPAPLKNGLYFGHTQFRNEGYYELLFFPGRAIPTLSPRRVVLLIDYDITKATIPYADVLESARTLLKQTLLPSDAFNVFVSRLTIDPVNPGWIPALPSAIDGVFDQLAGEPASAYSNLPGLLAGGIEFVNNTGGEGTVALISSSDQAGSLNLANPLLTDVQRLIGDSSINIHIADFSDGRATPNYIGDRVYRGNEYLYRNLARATGGQYLAIGTQGSLGAVLGEIFQAASGSIGLFDLHATMQTGFTYGRFSSTDGSSSIYLSEPVRQFGKYFGTFPFVLEASGVLNSVPFQQRLQIDFADAVTADTTLAAAWAGRQIAMLEAGPRTNESIVDVIAYSIDARVLSDYTAFIALEPEQGGDICTSEQCEDDSGT